MVLNPPYAPQNPVDAYLEALGAGSRRTIRQSLGVITVMLGGEEVAPEGDPRRFDWARVDQDAVARLRRELAERYAPATVNKMVAALRGILRVCRDQGRISEQRFQTATRFDRVKDFRAAESRVLSKAELDRLFRACADDGTAAGRRDAALLAIFLNAGLRREEATELDITDYDVGARTLHIRSGIAERDRLTEMGEQAGQAIDHWLDARGTDPGALILPVDKGGTIRFRRLTAQAVYGIVNRAAQRTGINHTTTKDLRRTCIVRLILAGLSITQIRQRVGHLSWLTTAAYRALAVEAGKLENKPQAYLPPTRPAIPKE